MGWLGSCCKLLRSALDAYRELLVASHYASLPSITGIGTLQSSACLAGPQRSQPSGSACGSAGSEDPHRTLHHKTTQDCIPQIRASPNQHIRLTLLSTMGALRRDEN